MRHPSRSGRRNGGASILRDPSRSGWPPPRAVSISTSAMHAPFRIAEAASRRVRSVSCRLPVFRFQSTGSGMEWQVVFLFIRRAVGRSSGSVPVIVLTSRKSRFLVSARGFPHPPFPSWKMNAGVGAGGPGTRSYSSLELHSKYLPGHFLLPGQRPGKNGSFWPLYLKKIAVNTNYFLKNRKSNSLDLPRHWPGKKIPPATHETPENIRFHSYKKSSGRASL